MRPMTALASAPLDLLRSRRTAAALTFQERVIARGRKRDASKLTAVIRHPFATFLLVGGVLGGALSMSAVQSGAYRRYVLTNGSPIDAIARGLGLGVNAITISGVGELKEQDILAIAGVQANAALPTLNVEEVRNRLRAIPLVKNVEIRRLYPNRLTIDITERQPYALWQKDGKIFVISSDGVLIDTLRDERFAALPMIVGMGANERISEYARILGAAGDLAPRFKAGALVSERRWSLFAQNGVEIKLPEINPEQAMHVLAQMQSDNHILDKGVTLIDMRIPGRVIARLTIDAANQRRENLSRSSKGKV